MRIFFIVAVLSAVSFFSSAVMAGSAIFFHPDGMGVNQWTAVRAVTVGPDGDLNWDKLRHVAVYKGHLTDGITPTSNGGATVHAYGVKARRSAYGLMDKSKLSIAHVALAEGKAVGLVNSGTITEPGTGVFVARVKSRYHHDAIVEQIMASGVQVILGGGEQWFLPSGVQGRHGAGVRKDNKNLIEQAKAQGYTVVYSAAELMALDIKQSPKLLGLFAANHTFFAKPDKKTALFKKDAPTIAQMTRQALAVLQAHHPDNFLLVAEEEGTDNFGNVMNHYGVLEAGKRADAAIGVIQEFITHHPDTTMVMTSDSDAGGMQIGKSGGSYWPFNKKAKQIISAPDKNGKTHKLGVLWTGKSDVAGGIVIRADGKYGHLVRGTMDNTAIYEILYTGLFWNVKP